MEGLSTPISESNKGNILLKKFGWNGGGLGQEGDGITEPIGIRLRQDNKGIGATEKQQTKIESDMSFVRASHS